jgi:hypothetical protein
MRKIIMPCMIFIVIMVACTTAKYSGSGEAEKQFVSTFLLYMDHEKGPMNDKMMECISPSYIKINHIDKEKMRVNNYSIWGSAIDYYDASDSKCVVKIWGENKKWVHELTFLLVKEKGKLYLMPSKYSESYIDPWLNVRSYIK